MSSNSRVRGDTFANNLRHRRNLSPVPPQPQPRLLTLISYKDDLPVEWLPGKRGRYSAGDIRDLQKHVEGLYGIGNDSTHSQRRGSAPGRAAPFKQSFATYLIHIYRRFNLPQFTLPHIQLPRLALPQTHRLAILPRIVPQYDQILPDAGPLVHGIFSFIRAVLAWSWVLLKLIWSVLNWPLVVVVAAALTVLVLLNVFATVYTITHRSFLDHFCKKELPVLRNMVCASWDTLQQQRKSNISEQLDLDLSQFFERYLQIQNEESTMSWEFPHWIARWESSIRRFRASLPESEFPPDEQQRFHDQFSKYIEHSDRATRQSRTFYTHIMGTIDHYIANTDWLVRVIEDTGVTSNVTVHIDGPMAQSMAFFNSYYMVYLIGGIEPFRTDVSQVATIEAVQLMEGHVKQLVQRLEIDIDMILSLATSLGDMLTVAEIIETYISRYASENNKANIRLPSGSIWGNFFGKGNIDQQLIRYEVNQQRQYLDNMRPDIQKTRAFLREAANEFGAAVGSCQAFQERLIQETQLIVYGFRSQWVVKQARTISEGSGDLKSTLKNFKLQKMRFDDRLFQREAAAEVPAIEG